MSVMLVFFPKLVKVDFYKPHHDNGMNGHFSTTVFLTDPQDYQGGELVSCILMVEKECLNHLQELQLHIILEFFIELMKLLWRKNGSSFLDKI